MASLVIQSNGQTTAGVFQRRVLIGRKPFNGVQFGQRAISRVHAWIDQEGNRFYIADAHSRAGTAVNGQRAEGKVELHDGDVIRVGPETLVFHTANTLPEGCVTFSIAENGTNPDFEDDGILIKCQCGAPLWVPASMAGAYGRCVHCGGEIDVPGEPASGIRRPLTPNDSLADMPAITELGSTEAPHDPLAADAPHPKPRPEMAEQCCGICDQPIRSIQSTKSCPTCSQLYHEKCWKQNGGCAAYGCAQAGLLQPMPEAHALEAEQMRLAELVAQEIEPPMPPAIPRSKPAMPPARRAPLGARSIPPAPRLKPPPIAAEPVEIVPEIIEQRSGRSDGLLLAGSVLGTILGAFTFGIPAFAIGTAAALYTVRARHRHVQSTRIAAVSMAISMIGVAIGIFTSLMLWFSSPFGKH
jgi:hypothetical protein